MDCRNVNVAYIHHYAWRAADCLTCPPVLPIASQADFAHTEGIPISPQGAHHDGWHRFALTSEQKMLQQLARDFSRSEIARLPSITIGQRNSLPVIEKGAAGGFD
ncbi:MAG: hypothetical protein U0559_17610 [Anaerolineae bacterium]